jgi:hypothetical protein
MDTIITWLDLIGREAIASATTLATTTWAWLVAQPLWLSVGIAVAGKATLIALVVLAHRRRQRSARIGMARERAKAVRNGHPAALNIRPREPRRTPYTPAAGAQHARELVLHGVPAIEISRRTGLSRDAVSLLLTQTGRLARQGRPTPAGLSPRARETGAGRRVELRA